MFFFKFGRSAFVFVFLAVCTQPKNSLAQLASDYRFFPPLILRSSCRKCWNNPHEVWQGEISLCATCKETAKGSRWFSWAIDFNIRAKMTIFVWILVSDLQCFKNILCITHFVKGFHVYFMLKFVFTFNEGCMKCPEWQWSNVFFKTQACRCNNTQTDNSVYVWNGESSSVFLYMFTSGMQCCAVSK